MTSGTQPPVALGGNTDGRQRPATIRAVAERAGVALSSVSRVLNDHPDVSPKMREKVLRAVDELGYEPDLLASSLRRGLTNSVGFIVTDIVNPLFASILRGAERRLREAGYSVLLAHSEGDPKRDVESSRLFRRRRVDGLLISLSDEERPETLAELSSFDIPLVLLDREIDKGLAWSAVLADHRTGLRRATDHLVELGHRDIRLVTGTVMSRPGRERASGFREVFDQRGIDIPERAVMHGDMTEAYGARAVEEMIAANSLPTALIVGGNLLFNGVVGALHRRGIRIGRDIALITCDDTPLAEFHEPAISVVSRDTEEMGRIAAQLLLDQLDGLPPRIETVPTSFIVRDSTFRATGTARG